jgi:hypothetical protein
VDLLPAAQDAVLEAELEHTVVVPPSVASRRIDDFFLSREKLLWDWPYVQDCLVQESD